MISEETDERWRDRKNKNKMNIYIQNKNLEFPLSFLLFLPLNICLRSFFEIHLLITLLSRYKLNRKELVLSVCVYQSDLLRC